MEADLLRAGYRLDDLGTPALSWRDLNLLQATFGPGSMTYRSIHGHDWGQSESMTAELIDAVQNLGWILVAVNTPKGRSQPKRPPEFPRPAAFLVEMVSRGEAKAEQVRSRTNPAHVHAWAEQMNGPAVERRKPGTKTQ
ncbi:hypothetical protein RCH12_002773 [Cryobacterium sp. MP_3.1]|uniref:hypothetical protein n=1 Tax=Cryobacterium sp. MP_3.1 TaxID=3071711 RepID=UPI002E0CE969|nr:hypothetical protein [Cryobacterium sp. MP_3.1]